MWDVLSFVPIKALPTKSKNVTGRMNSVQEKRGNKVVSFPGSSSSSECRENMGMGLGTIPVGFFFFFFFYETFMLSKGYTIA